jgi:hypothetical protein
MDAHQQSAAKEIASLSELIRGLRVQRDREAAARRTAELNAAQLDKDLETEVARCARAENLAAEEKAARFITEDRAEQAEAQVATLRTALVALRDLVKEGGVPRYTVTPGAALNTVIEEIVDPALAAIDKAA